MDSSRISSGRLRIDLRPTQLAELVKSSVETILPTAEAKGVNVAGDLGAETGMVMADPDRLRQVIWNLLTNAVKFTPAGGRVNVSMARVADGIEIRVADTGSGIAPEFLPHVFEAFRQGDGSITRVHGGLGLGLAITKQLVELHGGTVQAQSGGSGEGSTFIVRLPLAAMTAMAVTRSWRRKVDVSVAASPDGDEDLAGLRIVLVEDDADTRNALTLLLRAAGLEVFAFDSVAPAFDAMSKSPTDIVLSDIGLPGEDGYSFLKRVRKREAAAGSSPVPAIALTAFSRDQDREQARDAGFQAYLGKPIQPQQLVAAIRAVVKKG
jgi:CheY-like chemotaxis protein/anti-sigma regulatory factor (Ser/Thr protein kinase)